MRIRDVDSQIRGLNRIYGGPSTSYVSIGSISNREIITVLKTDGSMYHIEYYTSSGNKRGYISTSSINVPGFIYDYSRPITTGSRTNDYNPGVHNGIDIGVASGAYLYAITAGTANFKYAYSTTGGTPVTVSYGNFVELTFNGNLAIYAHMSAFDSYFNAAVSPYPNANPPRGSDSNTVVVTSAANQSVGKGQLLGRSGNSGNSTGDHLHFEVRDYGTTIVDPFKYVLFPKMPS